MKQNSNFTQNIKSHLSSTATTEPCATDDDYKQYLKCHYRRLHEELQEKFVQLELEHQSRLASITNGTSSCTKEIPKPQNFKVGRQPPRTEKDNHSNVLTNVDSTSSYNERNINPFLPNGTITYVRVVIILFLG